MLRQTPVYRNLEYQWRIFGRIDLLDAMVCGLSGLITEFLCFLFGVNMAWGLAVAIASFAGCAVLRKGLSSDEFLTMLRFTLRPHHYTQLKPESKMRPLI